MKTRILLSSRAFIKIISITLAFLLICTFPAPIQGASSQILSGGESAPFNLFDALGDAADGFLSDAMEVVRENWSDDYYMAITIEAGESALSVDGNLEPTEYPAVIEGGDIILPVADIAQAAGAEVLTDVESGSVTIIADGGVMEIESSDFTAEVPAGGAAAMFSARAAARPAASAAAIEDALGLEVELCGDSIVITNPYQLKQIILYVEDGGYLYDDFGASERVENGKGIYFLQYPSEAMTRAAYERYVSDARVRYVALNQIVMSQELPDRRGAERIHADKFIGYLDDYGKTDEDFIVAVVDTGVDATHPHLEGRTTSGYNFYDNNNNPDDNHGHGTQVAGIIADCTPQNVKIMPVRSLDDRGQYSDHLTISNGIKYAADNGAKIINLSVGGVCYDNNCLHIQAINYALAKGAVSVTASGNTGEDVTNYCPAKSANAITVAATYIDGRIVEFSNYGAAVDIAAPGATIMSSYPGGGYQNLTGTSAAAPFVSAGAALLMMEYPDYAPLQIKEKIKTLTVDYINNSNPGRNYGAGVLDLEVFFATGQDTAGVRLNTDAIIVDTPAAKYAIYKLEARVAPMNLQDKSVVYTTDNANVAVCDQDGTVRITGNGTAIITATANAHGLKASCVVNVNADESLFWFGSAAGAFDSGAGTAVSPYKIATPGQLALLAKNSWLKTENGAGSGKDEYYELTADIDLYGKEWISIGADGFYGHFNGNGHVIRNMRQGNVSAGDAVMQSGLFNRICGEVRDLGVIDADVKKPLGAENSRMIGVLAAEASGCTIMNCFTTGKSSGAAFVYAIDSSLTQDNETGAYGATVVKNCYSTAEAEAFIGTVCGADINNCYYYGDGLFIGNTFAAAGIGEATIINCFLVNKTTASYFIDDKEGASVINCYYPESLGQGINNDGNPAGTTLTAKPLSFFREKTSYTNAVYWDRRSLWDFISLWSIRVDINSGMPYLTGFENTFERAEAPIITVAPNISGIAVDIRSLTEGASIYYTLNNSTPSRSGLLYNGAIEFAKAGVWTVRAIAVKDGLADSTVTLLNGELTATGAINASRPSGNVREGTEIELIPPESGSVIYYTIDRSEPDTSGILYNGPIKLLENTVITARAYKPGKAAGASSIFAYTVLPIPPSPPPVTPTPPTPPATPTPPTPPATPQPSPSPSNPPSPSPQPSAQPVVTPASTPPAPTSPAPTPGNIGNTGVNPGNSGSTGAGGGGGGNIANQPANTPAASATPAPSAAAKHADLKDALTPGGEAAGEQDTTRSRGQNNSDLTGNGATERDITTETSDMTILNRFSDVNTTDWFYDDVEYAYANGLFKGLTDTLFGPDDPMTRAMVVTILYRASGNPDITGLPIPFWDVAADAYYYAPVIWAANNGIVVGADDGSFMPEENITRQQFAAILHRYAAFRGAPFPRDELEEVPGMLYYALDARFTDADKLFEYAWAPVLALAKKNIMQGDLAGRFNPDEYATRAQTAAILRRYYADS